MAGEGSNSSIAKRIQRSPRRRQPSVKQISLFVNSAPLHTQGSAEWGIYTRPGNGSGRRSPTQAKRKRWKRYEVVHDRRTMDMAVVVPFAAAGNPDHGPRGIHDTMGHSKEAQGRRTDTGTEPTTSADNTPTIAAGDAPIAHWPKSYSLQSRKRLGHGRWPSATQTLLPMAFMDGLWARPRSVTSMASLEAKPLDPRPLNPPFFPCPHGQIPHLLKVIDTGLAFVQVSKLGLVPETTRFHGALAMEMLVYGNFKPLHVRYSCFWLIMLQSSSEIFNNKLELGASVASIVTTPNHLQQLTTTLNHCEAYVYDFFPSITLQESRELMLSFCSVVVMIRFPPDILHVECLFFRAILLVFAHGFSSAWPVLVAVRFYEAKRL
ncbi:hypothetical protein Cgig2_011290 [Carnegiea gigantea]|uniref:Uncharacterized protein n=1 Tax=Carnegiea gigantea TaxID=171969 RepID=A0A9Q1GUY0_9CARY|nr:hypothetical protein Cgig2_011290 [Carnegiea gigantea]